MFVKKIILSFSLCFTLFGGFFGVTGNIHAQELSDAERTQLTNERNQLLKDIAALESQIKAQKANSASIGADISVLELQIKKKQTEIAEKNKRIALLTKNIGEKVQTINKLTDELGRERASFIQLIRKENAIQDYSFPEIFLSAQTMSDFYRDVDNFAQVKIALQGSATVIKNVRQQTDAEKQALLEQKNKEADVKYSLEQDKHQVEQKKTEKNTLLNVSKAQEKSYAQVQADKRAKVAAIEAKLFKLRDQAAIPFGEAYKMAKAAEKATGVRAAFILATLTQESNLGANMGTCYLKDTTTGAGVKISTGAAVLNVMKPTRDVQPFLEITKALGRDPYSTRVSCPFAVGYGGAMGAAQFIPSTWKIFIPRLAASLGVSTPDPWNPAHAIMANSLYMKDLGASAQTYTAERNAACKYYSGRGCDDPAVKNAFYGNAVTALAAKIQADIDLIEDN